jgi:hypothetical protein
MVGRMIGWMDGFLAEIHVVMKLRFSEGDRKTQDK